MTKGRATVLNSLFGLARPLLLALSPERAHEATLKSLQAGLFPHERLQDAGALHQSIWSLNFSNPVGIAAGFDKDASVPDAVLAMGCGFAEVGTLTPKPQPGNPAPRVFRLIAERAVINRLGFNNAGHTAALQRLRARRDRLKRSATGGGDNTAGVVGVNIGANKNTTDRIADYVAGLRTFDGLASYFAVNISSPNTPGLRDLQAPDALDELLDRLMAERQTLVDAGGANTPIIVKLSPDISEADLPQIVARLVAHKVDGIAVSNTTLSRANLTSKEAQEAGGLSGRPLFHRSTVMLARVYRETKGEIPLIGIGGIDSGETALAKIEAGASLIQLYTGLIYEGPQLIGTIKRHLANACHFENATSIRELTGRKAEAWAAKSLEN